MKMSYEAMIIAYISMFFIAIGLGLANLVIVHQNAALYQEYTIMMIEHYDTYDSLVANLIAQNTSICQQCSYNVESYNYDGHTSYQVEVIYQVKIPIINQVFTNSLVALTK